MKQGKKIIWQQPSVQRHRRFLQPIAVAIVCAVLIGLILTMGIMDLRRSENTLMDFMENQGLGIIGVVQRLAQENLNTLIQAHQKESEGSFVPATDDALSPQKSLTAALVELGKVIDNEWKADHLSEEYLKNFADEKGLWFVAVLDRRGKVKFQNRSLPADVNNGKTSKIIKKKEITLDLFSRLGRHKKIGFVALRRKDGSGTVIIALDREGLKYWGIRVSIENALKKLGQGQNEGLIYMTIVDRRNMVLGSTGQVPEGWIKADVGMSGILSGIKKFESRKLDFHDRKVLELMAPVYLYDQIVGVARLGLDREVTDKILEENKRNIIIFMTSVVLITLLSMWLLYRNQNRHLAGIVEMERRLEKAERLSALGHLAAGVAHEIRNPLNAISMASQRLKREYMPADEEKTKEFQVLAGVIRDEIRRLDGIIEEFLTFSRSRRLNLHEYPVTEVLQKIVNLFGEEASSKGIAIETRFSNKPAVIPMDVDKLQQALLNFVKNAVESISGNGTVILSVEPWGWDRISIKISDSGCGMTSEEVEQIFNPEYTTKEKGLGLGLPLAHEIIRGHGGEIRVLSQQGAGTTFEIILPTKMLNDKEPKG